MKIGSTHVCARSGASSIMFKNATLERIFCVLLACVLGLSLVPAGAWASSISGTNDATALAAAQDEGASGESAEGASAGESAEDAAAGEGESTGDAETDAETDADASSAASGEADGSAADGQQAASSSASGTAVSASATVADAETVTATCKIIGVDADGDDEVWASAESFDLEVGSTAADISEAAFAKAGLEADYGDTGWGWYLNTIASPDTGEALGWDENTGKYWQLFVNEECASSGAGDIELTEGDSVVWYYSAWGTSLPSDDDLVVDATATVPDNYTGIWSGYTQGSDAGDGSATSAATPTDSAELSWSYSFGGKYTAVSTPLIALATDEDGTTSTYVYIVSGGKLQKLDASTGELVASATVGSTFSYCCRPVFTDGLIIVPGDDGSLAAFTADTLTCVWKTSALEVGDGEISYQALSALTVSNGVVYAGFTAVSSGDGVRGALVAVDISDGTVLWIKVDRTSSTGEAEGYYWAGAAVSGSDIIIGGESGKVVLIEGFTGAVTASVDLGSACRSGVTAVSSTLDEGGNGVYVVATVDGVLHSLVREGNALVETGSVRFCTRSTSTPTVVDGTVYVCGQDSDGYGTLSLIDLDTMTVTATVRGGQGASQSAPLVSQQGGTAVVYFTCNVKPGGVYAYTVGDSEAVLIYTPDEDVQEYCLSSVIADADGNLYYTNDSGTLFCLTAASGDETDDETASSDSSSSSASSVSSSSASKTSKKPSSKSGSSSSSALSGSSAAVPASASDAVSTVSFALQSNTAADFSDGEDAAAADADASDEAASADKSTSVSDETGVSEGPAASDDADDSGIPLWPIIGIIIAAAVLLWLLLARRRKRDDEEE